MRKSGHRCGLWLLAALMLVGCTGGQGVDVPTVRPAGEDVALPTQPHSVEPGYQLAYKPRPWENATVVEYTAHLGRTGRFIVYYAFRGQEPPSEPPATIGMGCVVDPQARGHGARAETQLRATVDGVPFDFGSLDYQPGVGADSYWREGVPYAEARRLAGTAVHVHCAGMEFMLTPRQAQALRRFFGQDQEADR